MAEQVGTDVKTNAGDAGAAASSTTEQTQVTQGQEGTDGQVTSSNTTAESQNTDNFDDVKEGQSIPYERFKKLIDHKNKLKTDSEDYKKKLDEYDSKKPVFDAYSLIDEKVASNKEAAEAFKDFVGKYVRNEQAKGGDVSEVKNGNTDFTQEYAKEVFSAYNDELIDEIKTKYGEDKNLIATIGTMVTKTLDDKYKNWRVLYKPNLIKKAMADVQQSLDKVFAKEKESYISKKETVASNKSSAPAKERPVINTWEEREAYRQQVIREHVIGASKNE